MDQRLWEAIAYWNLWGDGSFAPGVAREARERLLPWLDRPEVIALCGVRRCGKSTLMRQLLRSLVEERQVPARDTLFVSFEDPAFIGLPLDVTTLDRIFTAYFEHTGPVAVPYLFLDEVHNVEGWERWARARAETGRARIVVSGSSSQLLDPDLAPLLTGRHLTHTLWPLSFSEHLRFAGIDLPREASARRAEAFRQAARIRRELVRYLQFGGFPEVVLAAEEDVRTALLKQYFRDLLYRDVVRRHEIRDVRGLETVAHHYLVNTASLATYNRLKNTYGLTMDAIRAYTRFLDESFLIREVPRFSFKVTVQGRAPRKVYAVDVGLRNAVAFRFSQDLGRLAETVVFNHLVRDPDIRVFYFKERGECDFVTWRGPSVQRAVQVCYEAEGELPSRELAGLLEAMEALDLADGLLVTRDVEREIESAGRKVRAVPLWLWLLEES